MMEKPLYPSQYMRITQGYMQGTHQDSYAIDEAGSDAGIDYMKAPFTGIIKKIYTNDANEVWLESVEPVEYPDGTIDYMTMLFAHDNDVSNLSVGQIISKGARFYEEGTAGNATGNHVHIECGKGKFTGTGWHENSAGYWSINNGKNPTECLWIDDSITIMNDFGYSFRKVEETPVEILPETPAEPEKNNEEEKPEEDKQEEKPKEPMDKPVKEEPKLIFTCPKTDIYAIKLEKNQKLYLL